MLSLRLGAAIPLAFFACSLLILHVDTLNADAFRAVQRWTRLLPDVVWATFTICGTGIAAFALLSPTLAWRPTWMAATFIAAVPAGIYSAGLKHLLTFPRPAHVLDAGEMHVIGQRLLTHSFPSGHVVTAFTLAAVLVLASRRPAAMALWVVPIASLIAVSRIAVGAHWPADLAAGAAGGWLSGTLGVAIASRWTAWNTLRGIRIMALAIIGIGVSLFTVNLGYPLVTPLQHAMGVVALLAGTAAMLWPRLAMPGPVPALVETSASPRTGY